jgi:hypothetical protein
VEVRGSRPYQAIFNHARTAQQKEGRGTRPSHNRIV